MSKVEPSSLRFAAPRGGRTRAGEWPAAQFVLTLNSQLSTINYDFTLVLFHNRPPGMRDAEARAPFAVRATRCPHATGNWRGDPGDEYTAGRHRGGSKHRENSDQDGRAGLRREQVAQAVSERPVARKC